MTQETDKTQISVPIFKNRKKLSIRIKGQNYGHEGANEGARNDPHFDLSGDYMGIFICKLC